MYLFHFVERDPSDPYQRPIVSDAKGYYAYLPAIFIYQDLQYNFLDEVDQKYYAVGHDKHIFIEQNGHRVNKTFPGVGVLYLPFFLIAHFLASILGLAADGYSDIYQYMFDFGQFFYATLGLVLLGKVLHKLNFSKKTVLIAVFCLVLGTNLWFYIVYDQSLTHIYNFFLINALVFYVLKLKDEIHLKNLTLTFGIIALLIIIRPTSVLSLFVVVFFVPKRKFYLNILSSLKSVKNTGLLSLVIGIILSVPLLLWKIQSGDWIVYSYGEEGFDFSNPQIINFLFSYAKGWWLYSPLILFSIVFGSTLLFQKAKKGRFRLMVLLLFLIASIYVFSSWWCWWYGFSFGQRPMVDFYILIGFLLALIIQNVQNSKIKQVIFGSSIAVFTFFNLLQSYQHHHGFFQWSKPNAEIYWDNFLRFKMQAKVYVEEDWELLSSENLTIDIAENEQVLHTDFDNQFSETVMATNSKIHKSSFAIVSFKVNPETNLNNTDLVLEYRGEKSTYRNLNFNKYLTLNEWVKIELKYDVSGLSDSLVMYFWNKESKEKAIFKHIKIDFYK